MLDYWLFCGLIYGIFAFPLDNVSDIWFYDFIVTVDEAFTFYTDSISFRYRLIDLFVTGFTIGIIASGILWVQEENLVGDAWKLIPMGLFLASGIEFILSIYGFIAMIVNEIISLNVVWVSPIILSIAFALWFYLIYQNVNYIKVSNIPKPIVNVVKENLTMVWNGLAVKENKTSKNYLLQANLE